MDYRTLIEVMAEGVVQQDSDGAIILYNKAAKKILGISFDQLKRQKTFFPKLRLIREDGSDFSEEENPAIVSLRTGEPQRNVIMGILKPEGEITWILVNSEPFFENGNENPTSVVSTYTDISENKAFENELKRSEEIYHKIINTAEQGFIKIDKDENIIEANNSFCKLIGYSSAEILGKQLVSFLDETNRHHLNAKSRTVDKYSNREYQISIQHKNGQEIPVLLSVTSILDEKNVIIGKFAFCQDVSKFINVINEQSKLKTAIEQSPSTIVITDEYGLIEYVNPQFQIETGYSFSEVKGGNPSILKSNYHSKEFYKEMWDTLLDGKIWKGEFRNRKKNGEEYWENAVIAPVYNFFGEIKNFVAIKEDITQRKHVEDNLKNSEEKYRFLTESVLDAIWSFNVETLTFSYMSPAIERILGYSSEVFLTMSVDDLMSSETKEKFVEVLNQRRKLHNPNLKSLIYTDEIQLFHKCGKLVWVEILSYFQYNPVAKKVAVIGTARDVNARKKIEFELVQSEQRFRTLFESASVIVCLHRLNGEIISANKMMASITGYSVDELERMNLKELDPHYIERENYGSFWEKLNELKTINFESQYLRKDGSFIPIDVKLTPVELDGEDLILGFAFDITMRKQYEEKILTLNSQLNEAQRIAKIGNWTNIFNSKSIEWSDTTYEIFGYQPNEAKPLSIFSKHIDKRDKRKFWTYILELQKTKEQIINPIEFRIIDKNGEVKFCRANGKFNYDDKQRKVEAFGTIQDITTLKNIELELTKSIQTKDKFFSIISHDLRSPFSALLGLSQLMVDDVSNNFFDNVGKYAYQINKTTNQSYELLNNLLSWARIQTNRMEYAPEIVQIKDVQNSVVEQIIERARNKKIDIEYLNDNNFEIYVDKNMIQSVIRNLLSNAVKFTPEGGNVSLKVEQHPTEIIFKVSDNGVGISKQDIDNLFEPDNILSAKGTNNEPGTGLGLLLCKDFIDMHGGKIWVDSKMKNINTGEKGKTTFSFSIPLQSND